MAGDRRYPRWGCGSVATLFLAVICSAGAASGTPEESAIVSAKKDYELIKEVSRGSNRTTAESVKQSVPPLELPADRIPVLSPIQRAKLLEAETKPNSKPSSGWLVDAMSRKDVVPAKSRKTDQAEPNAEDLLASAANRRNEHDDKNPTRANAPDSSVVSKSNPVANPLDSYMASWMSSQDLQLFRSAAKTGEPVFDGVAPLSDAAKFSMEATAAPSLTSNLEKRMSEISAPNPYVVDLAPTLSGTNLPPPASLNQSGPLPSTVNTTVAAPTANQGATPLATVPATESLRNSDDARYFKQLKRF